MNTPKIDTFRMMLDAFANQHLVFWSPSTRVYCSFVSGNWSFTCTDPIIAGAHKNCPAPLTEDWEQLVRKEPQRGDVHPSCESCGSAMGYTGNTVVCTDPLVSTDRLHPARIPRPEVSYCSNHTSLKTCECPDEPELSSTFQGQLTRLLNRHSKENESNTPDFILAEFLNGCLRAYNEATRGRDKWYQIAPKPGKTIGEILNVRPANPGPK